MVGAVTARAELGSHRTLDPRLSTRPGPCAWSLPTWTGPVAEGNSPRPSRSAADGHRRKAWNGQPAHRAGQPVLAARIETVVGLEDQVVDPLHNGDVVFVMSKSSVFVIAGVTTQSVRGHRRAGPRCLDADPWSLFRTTKRLPRFCTRSLPDALRRAPRTNPRCGRRPSRVGVRRRGARGSRRCR